MARRYSAFMVRCWHLANGDQRYAVEDIQTGALRHSAITGPMPRVPSPSSARSPRDFDRALGSRQGRMDRPSPLCKNLTDLREDNRMERGVCRPWTSMPSSADFPTLDTPRLTLRPLQPDDPDLIAIFRDPEVQRYAYWSAILEQTGMDAFLDIFKRVQAEHDVAVWGVAPKEIDRVVGFVGIFMLRTNPDHPELAYAFAPATWGQGYATEAAQAAINCVFSSLDVNRIEGIYSIENLQSGRVLAKIGM